MSSLTARQRQVLTLAAFGNTNVQIGRQLGIHGDTVNRHLVSIYGVLGARDRANAVALAIHGGDISLGELGRIAAAAPVQGGEGPREAADRAVAASQRVGGAPVVRGAVRAADGRTAPDGRQAAWKPPGQPTPQPRAERPSEAKPATRKRHP